VHSCTGHRHTTWLPEKLGRPGRPPPHPAAAALTAPLPPPPRKTARPCRPGDAHPATYLRHAVNIQTGCIPCKTYASSYGFSILLHHTAIPHGFTQLLSTVFQGLQFFSISPYKIFWIFLPKNRNYCQFMSINAVFLQQLTQLQFVHSLQLSANRCTLHTKARDR